MNPKPEQTAPAATLPQEELFSMCIALEQLTTSIMSGATGSTLNGILTERKEYSESDNAYWYLIANYDLLASCISFARATAHAAIDYMDKIIFPVPDKRERERERAANAHHSGHRRSGSSATAFILIGIKPAHSGRTERINGEAMAA